MTKIMVYLQTIVIHL